MAKRKVAVLGGGVGAISAAWALTSQPGARDAYEVHVYQVGWRLGGKGASGRNPLQGQRIEEHGLHIWSGFYDNAFRVMRACFDELQDEPNTYRSVDEAFFPDNNIVLGERTAEGWKKWAVEPAMNDGVPGEGDTDLSPWGYFVKLVALMRATLDRLDPDGAPLGTAVPRGEVGDNILGRLAEVGQALGEAPLHLLDAFASVLRGDDVGRGVNKAGLGHLAQQVQNDIKARRARIADRAGIGDDIRRGLQLLDLGGAVLRGMVEDRVLTRGFDAIDNEEVSAWLEKHGAEPESVDGSLIVAVYDYVFGFRGGATVETARAIAAGTFLRGTLRLMLTYKGAIFYKMRAGMGDTIFTPLYKALRKRGVHFHFFHRVRGLHLDPTSTLVDFISVDRQVTIRPDAEGLREYRPFVTVKGLDCWPSEPLWEQIEEAGALKSQAEGSEAGDEAGGRLGSADLESSWTDWQPVERLTLRRGQDFDEVILGIPVGALPTIAGELVEVSAAWKRMVTRVQTTATQAVQLWLAKPTEELGWEHGASILTAYEDALNTWADMSHLLPVEDWRGGPEPRSVAYFCGPLADPPVIPPFTDIGYPGRMREQVKSDATRWLELCNDYIFPGLRRADGSIDLDQLVCDGGDTPGDRWSGQYFRANVEPTERYVLSVPGSTTARLRADRSGFGNLWLAGDWTYTGINAGCVEGAVMSGMRAAAGLAGIVPDIVGEEADPIPGGARVDPEVSAPVLKTYRPQNSPWPWSALYGMAETTGPCVTLAYPRDAVARMLPPGLALAPQVLTGPDSHPVILLFGQQRDVRMNALPRGMTSYLEFICAVPYVIHADPRLGRMPPMIWPQKLYLDSDPPIGLGVWGYGFPKERASMLLDGGSYIVRDRRTGQEILSCSWASKGARDRAFAFPQFSRVRPAYEMAMVTKRPLLGNWQYSVYDFSLDSALLEPIDMEVRVGPNSFGLPPGLVRPPSIADGALGAFFLTADGTINNPLQSREIQQRLRDMAQ